MWTSLKHTMHIVVKNIPVGIGMGFGVALGGAALGGVTLALSGVGRAVKRVADRKVTEVVQDRATAPVEASPAA